MQLITSLLLLNAGALAVQPRLPKLAPRSADTLNHFFGSNLVSRQSCDGQECADGCIDLSATCCDITVGIYCEAGTSCTTSDTCCTDGVDCDGDSAPVGCDDDEIECGPGKLISPSY